MKTMLLAVTLLLFGTATKAADFTLDVGKSFMGAQDTPGGVAGIGLRSRNYEATLWWIGETTIYDGALTTKAFPLLTVARRFTSTRTLFGAHYIGIMGLGFKSADRCAKNGEIDCNRKMPLPVSFHFGAGLEWKELSITVYHDSNDALDYGPEKKNLGANFITLRYRL